MIGFFPELLPDEVLYSGLARYCDALGIREYPRAREALFGDHRGPAVVELPGRLGTLAARLPPGAPYTVDRLVAAHTMLPYYRPFKRPDQVARVERALAADGWEPGPIQMVLVGATRVRKSAFLSYCAACVAADRARHGVAYWHRAHQLPGVRCCHLHRTPLAASSVQPKIIASRLGYFTLEDVLPETEAQAPDGTPRPVFAVAPGSAGDTRTGTNAALRLAQDTAWLLQANTAGPGLSALRRRYHEALRAAGFGRGTVQIRVPVLRRAITAHYGAAFLAGLRAETAARDGGSDWVSNAARNAQDLLHPLHHLLLCQFLGLRPADLLGDAPAGAVTSTGTGDVLGAARSATRPGHPLATAGDAPPVDAPAARRTDEARAGAAPRRRGQKLGVLSPEWEARLRQLVEDDRVSLAGAARALGVTETTVKRHAHRLGVWRVQWSAFKAPVPSQVRREARGRADRDRARDAYALLRRDHPDHSRTELESLAPRVVQWLRRHDVAWLRAQQPPRRPARPLRPLVDWGERDAALRPQVDEARAQLLARTRPVRVTVTALLRQMGCLGLLPHIGRLPVTNARLREVAESARAFADRRLARAAALFRVEGVAPTLSGLLRRAAIGKADWRRLGERARALVADLASAAACAGTPVT